jgi:glycosyltransferase involved in cell wall biosynthesis
MLLFNPLVKTMRIGFDAKRAFFNQSGLGNYSRTLISQMSLLFPENEYFLFSPKNPSASSGFPPENKKIIKPSQFLHKQFPSIWRSAFMGQDIRNYKIQLFHGLSNELPLDIQKSNARSVVTIHDLIFLRYPNLYNRADRAIYKSKFQRSCKLADAVVAISEQTKADIVHFFNIPPEKIHVIYQACNPLYYSLASDDIKKIVRKKYSLPEKYMLYVGTIEERKNLLQLITAKNEYKIPLPLLVIGRPTPYLEKVREYITKHNIQDILFLKSLDQEELPAIYQMAELFIYPSSFEGFGIPILEALNSGVPVITGTGSCMPETGGPHSIYINPLQTSEIADSIKLVLNNPELKRKMVEEGKKHALLFREERTAGEMMKLYQKLL